MTPKDLAISQLRGVEFLFDSFLKDMNDKDTRFQPCKDGLHIDWMLMHLASSADGMIAGISGQPKQFPAEIAQRYAGGSPCKADDPITRADALRHFQTQLKRSIDFVATFPESKYDDPAPQGMPPQFPNVGSVIGLLAAHPYWHFGQLTVNRRMLGKPKIF